MIKKVFLVRLLNRIIHFHLLSFTFDLSLSSFEESVTGSARRSLLRDKSLAAFSYLFLKVILALIPCFSTNTKRKMLMRQVITKVFLQSVQYKTFVIISEKRQSV